MFLFNILSFTYTSRPWLSYEKHRESKDMLCSLFLCGYFSGCTKFILWIDFGSCSLIFSVFSSKYSKILVCMEIFDFILGITKTCSERIYIFLLMVSSSSPMFISFPIYFNLWTLLLSINYKSSRRKESL